MKKYSDASDTYLYPETGVLKNKLNIQSSELLERAEKAATSLRQEELSRNPVQGNFDLQHLLAIHKKMFGDVYEWAGKTRTVDISKGQSRFAHYAFIDTEFEKLSIALSGEKNLRDLPPEQFCFRAAHYMGEMNVIHPFREGNGRTLRVLVGQLAQDAGYDIKWEGIKQEEMLHASIAAYQGSSDYLAQLIRENLVNQKSSKEINHTRADNTLGKAAQPDEIHTASDSLLSQAQTAASEQRALLESAPVEQTWHATLKQYVEAKHEQIGRIEVRLGQAVEKQEAQLKQTQASPPKHKWYASQKTKTAAVNTWRGQINRQAKRLYRLQYLQGHVGKIKEGTDSRCPTVEELATRKMRRDNPELAGSWDAMREAVRLKEQQARQEREKQHKQSQQQSQGQTQDQSLSHRLRP